MTSGLGKSSSHECCSARRQKKDRFLSLTANRSRGARSPPRSTPPRLRRFARSPRSTAPAETSSFQARSSVGTAFPVPRTGSAPPRETTPGSPATPASGATCAAASPPGRRFPSRARNAPDPSPARSETNTTWSRLRRSRSLSSRASTWGRRVDIVVGGGEVSFRGWFWTRRWIGRRSRGTISHLSQNARHCAWYAICLHASWWIRRWISNPKVILGSMMTFSSGSPGSSNTSSDSARTRTRAARAAGTGTRRANPGVDGVAPRIRFAREATHADIPAARRDSVFSSSRGREVCGVVRENRCRRDVHDEKPKSGRALPRRRVFPRRVRVVLRLRRRGLGRLAFPV